MHRVTPAGEQLNTSGPVNTERGRTEVNSVMFRMIWLFRTHGETQGGQGGRLKLPAGILNRYISKRQREHDRPPTTMQFSRSTKVSLPTSEDGDGPWHRPGILHDATFIRHVASPYSPAQVNAYLDKIGWSPGSAAGHRSSHFEPNAANLRRLMYLHLLAFPQDTSALHYTREHHMPVTPREMYESIVVNNYGSYCFGQNGLLLGMLRGLGYRAYAAAGRVLVPPSPPSPHSAALVYSAPHHLVLLVQPHNSSASHGNVTYMVDVGFGGTGPVRPILLADGSAGLKQRTPEDHGGDHEELDGESTTTGGWVWGTYPPERHRLVRGALPDSSLETHAGSGRAPVRDWHLQVSHASARPSNVSDTSASAEKSEWTTLYSFAEAEFFQADIDAASFAVSRMPGSFFLTTVICTRRFAVVLQSAEDEEELRLRDKRALPTSIKSAEGLDSGDAGPVPFVGKWNLEGGRATKRIGREVVEERRFATESDRVEILRDVFGVGVRSEDEQWIVGWPSSLRSDST